MGLSAAKLEAKTSEKTAISKKKINAENVILYNIVSGRVQNIDKDVWEKNRSSAYKPVYV